MELLIINFLQDFDIVLIKRFEITKYCPGTANLLD